MHRKLTILFAFAFFVLVIGWTVQPVHAHGPGVDGGCPHNRQNHPHCAQGGGNGGGGKEKVAVCHSDCFGWDGFIMYVKNVDAHVGHGDTAYPPDLATNDPDFFRTYYLFNDDYCCDYPRIIDPENDSLCCDPKDPDDPTKGCI